MLRRPIETTALIRRSVAFAAQNASNFRAARDMALWSVSEYMTNRELDTTRHTATRRAFSAQFIDDLDLAMEEQRASGAGARK